MSPSPSHARARLDRAFSALSHPIRRAILTRLTRDGTATVTELAEAFPVSVMAISKHLRRMEEAGLVRREKTGRARHCSALPSGLEAARDWIEDHRRFWEGRLDALAGYLEDTDHHPPRTRTGDDE